MESIGEQIRAARKAKGLTQDALAEMMNVSRQAVSHWETNRTMPDAETLIKLSKALGYSFEATSAEQSGLETPEEKQEDAKRTAQVPDVIYVKSGDRILHSGVGKRFPKTAMITTAVICAVLVTALVFLLPRLLHRPKSAVPDAGGKNYAISDYDQTTPYEADKAYLSIIKKIAIRPGQGKEY